MTSDPETRTFDESPERQESRAELARERQIRLTRTLFQAALVPGAGLRRTRESASVTYDLWDNVPI